MKIFASSFFIGLLALASWIPSARAQFVIPELTSPVIDAGDMISARDEEFLRKLIYRFRETHQAQIQVLTVKTLSGVPIEQASIQVTDQWNLGDKKRDDGALLLVSATERKIRIEVGQGLEGVIPDVKAKRIIADVMAPVFRQSGPSQGIVIGVFQIMKLIDPQFTDSEMGDSSTFHEQKQTPFQKYQGLFVLLFIVVMLILNNLRPGGGRFYGGFGGGGFGGGGSSGGGGWSGGGGGFSGGGSSGDW